MTNQNGALDKFFKLSEHGTNVRTEIIAGITTFMTMGYILAVNPFFLSQAGMDAGAVFTATVISSFIATLVMGLYANLPFALAPGMGLNAFFAFTVVLGMGYSWQFALTAVLFEGIIFLILTFFNVREAILNSIPLNIKKAISVGIGLFIAFIGLYNNGNGLILTGGGTPLAIVHDLFAPGPMVIMIGVILISVLLAKKVKGAIFIGILASTVIAIPFGLVTMPDTLVQMPTAPLWLQFEFDKIMTFDFVFILFTFLFVDMFDTVGTLIGVATKADMLDEEGKLPGAKEALMADAIGTTVGAMLGTSTVTTYVESASGVAEGGRTGLTAVSTAVLFLVSVFLSPLFLMIPGAATAPALIIVGLFMMSPIKDIDLDDFTESVPAFFAIIMMPLTYSISEGIMFGIMLYIILKVLVGKAKEITPFTYIVFALFVLKLLFPVLKAMM